MPQSCYFSIFKILSYRYYSDFSPSPTCRLWALCWPSALVLWTMDPGLNMHLFLGKVLYWCPTWISCILLGLWTVGPALTMRSCFGTLQIEEVSPMCILPVLWTVGLVLAKCSCSEDRGSCAEYALVLGQILDLYFSRPLGCWDWTLVITLRP